MLICKYIFHFLQFLQISGDACMTAVNNGDVKTDPYPLQMYAKIIKRFDRVDYRENESDS